VEDTPAPETPAPAIETPAPVEDTPAPETPAPAVETPAPVEDTPAPETPAPALETPAPAEDTPAPETPAPAVETPAPVEDTPAQEVPSPQVDPSLPQLPVEEMPAVPPIAPGVGMPPLAGDIPLVGALPPIGQGEIVLPGNMPTQPGDVANLPSGGLPPHSELQQGQPGAPAHGHGQHSKKHHHRKGSKHHKRVQPYAVNGTEVWSASAVNGTAADWANTDSDLAGADGQWELERDEE
jgi:hypothetical protein